MGLQCGFGSAMQTHLFKSFALSCALLPLACAAQSASAGLLDDLSLSGNTLVARLLPLGVAAPSLIPVPI